MKENGFPCRSGVVFQNRTDQVISYHLAFFLCARNFFQIKKRKKMKKLVKSQHVYFQLQIRSRLPKQDRSSYQLQFDKLFHTRAIFYKFKKTPKTRQITACKKIFFFSGPESSSKTGQIKLSATI
jgi:hypothetical protein